MYMSYFGIRVTDLPRSVEFYTRCFGLVPTPAPQAPTRNPEAPASVLLFDPVSSQRLELNYYPPGNPYAVPYAPGEGWDHLAFRVEDLDAFLAAMRLRGFLPKAMKHFDGTMMSTPTFRVAYLSDPDGNEIEVFDTPGADAARYDREAY